MKIKTNECYHLYNRGNNQQSIFFKRENYLYFLRKVRKYIKPHVRILAYCLMPNHFHFLILPRSNFILSKFSEDIRIMLSSYTKGINNQEDRTGSLFQQNTKAKKIVDNDSFYPILRCFHDIHQNPLNARLVSRMESWEYSSFRDFVGLRNGTLCDKAFAIQLLELPEQKEAFYNNSYHVINTKIIKDFYA